MTCGAGYLSVECGVLCVSCSMLNHDLHRFARRRYRRLKQRIRSFIISFTSCGQLSHGQRTRSTDFDVSNSPDSRVYAARHTRVRRACLDLALKISDTCDLKQNRTGSGGTIVRAVGVQQNSRVATNRRHERRRARLPRGSHARRARLRAARTRLTVARLRAVRRLLSRGRARSCTAPG
eukprot:scaffold99997_cov48-Phaeocystis_antarctica.AAC.2